LVAEDGQPHLLVVDDDRRLRELLRDFLGRNGYRVNVAADAAEARRQVAGFAFDLMILDVMMPGETGLELARSVRDDSNLPILLLTARGEAADRIAGLEAGADDYLPKPFEPRELLLRIGAILRRAPPSGGAPLGGAARQLRLGDCRFDAERGELWRGADPVRLTTGEAQLLTALARKAGQTVSRQELAGGEEGGARAVDVQVTRLRRKIEPDPKQPRYLQTVWGEGYVLRPD
jgi:two-component system, OmpR family, phosphate regulon response regulator OmpR